jgi:hypothetical protein
MRRSEPRQRSDRSPASPDSGIPRGACVVCGLSDGRQLVTVELGGKETAILCGSHALLHSRTGAAARNVAELRASLSDRRSGSRRITGGDELGETLTAAFIRDRRSGERRTG